MTAMFWCAVVGLWLVAGAMWTENYFHLRSLRLSAQRLADDQAARAIEGSELATISETVVALQSLSETVLALQSLVQLQRQRAEEAKQHEQRCEHRYLERIKAMAHADEVIQ